MRGSFQMSKWMDTLCLLLLLSGVSAWAENVPLRITVVPQFRKVVVSPDAAEARKKAARSRRFVKQEGGALLLNLTSMQPQRTIKISSAQVSEGLVLQPIRFPLVLAPKTKKVRSRKPPAWVVTSTDPKRAPSGILTVHLSEVLTTGEIPLPDVDIQLPEGTFLTHEAVPHPRAPIDLIRVSVPAVEVEGKELDRPTTGSLPAGFYKKTLLQIQVANPNGYAVEIENAVPSALFSFAKVPAFPITLDPGKKVSWSLRPSESQSLTFLDVLRRTKKAEGTLLLRVRSGLDRSVVSTTNTPLHMRVIRRSIKARPCLAKRYDKWIGSKPG